MLSFAERAYLFYRAQVVAPDSGSGSPWFAIAEVRAEVLPPYAFGSY